MLRKNHFGSKRNDHAISPVIGTILMVAATVIIAGAVYAAINAYGGKAAKPPVDASWKAQTLDADGNGLDDTIKITYLSGPVNADAASVTVVVKNSATGLQYFPPSAGLNHTGAWNPGDFTSWTGPCGAAGSATEFRCLPLGSYFVTVSQSGSTVLDQQIQTRQ